MRKLLHRLYRLGKAAVVIGPALMLMLLAMLWVRANFFASDTLVYVIYGPPRHRTFTTATVEDGRVVMHTRTAEEPLPEQEHSVSVSTYAVFYTYIPDCSYDNPMPRFRHFWTAPAPDRHGIYASTWPKADFLEGGHRLVQLPFWFLALMLQAPVAFWLFQRLRRRWRHPGDGPKCPGCGYDLRAHQAGQKCPECGRVMALATATASSSQ